MTTNPTVSDISILAVRLARLSNESKSHEYAAAQAAVQAILSGGLSGTPLHDPFVSTEGLVEALETA